jgi:hypothetical protein
MTLAELETYLDTFSEEIPGLAQVIHGDEMEILNRQNSRIQYPCMWVESPEVRLVEDGRRFSFSLTFLAHVPKVDTRLERSKRSITLELAERAMRKLEDDEESGLFQLEGNMEGTPILKYSGDNDTGYRFSVALTTGREDC